MDGLPGSGGTGRTPADGDLWESSLTDESLELSHTEVCALPVAQMRGTWGTHLQRSLSLLPVPGHPPPEKRRGNEMVGGPAKAD
jgi:hypothetical protein